MKEGRRGERREVERVVGGETVRLWSHNIQIQILVLPFLNCATFTKLTTSYPVLLFLTAVTRTSKKSNFRKEGVLWVHSSRDRPSWPGSHSSSAWDNGSHFVCSQEENGECLCSPRVRPLIQLVGPIPWERITHYRVALPTPFKAVETTPHRYTRGCLLCGSCQADDQHWPSLSVPRTTETCPSHQSPGNNRITWRGSSVDRNTVSA